jgi:hypothetical protein
MAPKRWDVEAFVWNDGPAAGHGWSEWISLSQHPSEGAAIQAAKDEIAAEIFEPEVVWESK